MVLMMMMKKQEQQTELAEGVPTKLSDCEAEGKSEHSVCLCYRNCQLESCEGSWVTLGI